MIQPQNPITVKKEVESEDRPKSKRQVVKAKEKLGIGTPNLSLIVPSRKIKFSSTVTDDSQIEKCYLFIDSDMTLPYDKSQVWTPETEPGRAANNFAEDVYAK